MLDKRRFNTSPRCIFLFSVCLFLTGCIFIWFINGFVAITIHFSNNFVDSRYSLLTSKNNMKSKQSYSINQLTSNDKHRLIDLKNFKFTMNHNICNKTEPFLVILIHSAPANYKKRKVIRETWGRDIPSIITLFLVGTTEKYKTALEKENKHYEDLIQGNFLDAYRNMTYKHAMALKWVTYYCSNVRYILKSDDDVFVHVSALLNYLKQGLSLVSAEPLILCDAILNLKVRRSWRSKWRVSPKEYPGKEYPSYCAGWAILYSYDTAFLLYQEAQKEPFFWIDDVHITGTLAKKINVTQTSIHSMILNELTMKNLLEKQEIEKEFLFGPPNLKEKNIRALHKAVAIVSKT